MSWSARRHRETGLDGGRRTGSGDCAESPAAGRGALGSSWCHGSLDPWMIPGSPSHQLVVTGTCCIFPSIENHDPNWLLFFSEGLKHIGTTKQPWFFDIVMIWLGWFLVPGYLTLKAFVWENQSASVQNMLPSRSHLVDGQAGKLQSSH